MVLIPFSGSPLARFTKQVPEEIEQERDADCKESKKNCHSHQIVGRKGPLSLSSTAKVMHHALRGHKQPVSTS
jgi:hypothetical protein